MASRLVSYAVSEAVNGGRRTARFKPDAPINHFFSIQSARYEVRRDTLGDIELAVYFHPGHGHNVERMLKAMKASLITYGKQLALAHGLAAASTRPSLACRKPPRTV